MTYNEWKLQAKREFERNNVSCLFCDSADYRDMYDEGMTPKECYEEEIDAARANC